MQVLYLNVYEAYGWVMLKNYPSVKKSGRQASIALGSRYGKGVPSHWCIAGFSDSTATWALKQGPINSLTADSNIGQWAKARTSHVYWGKQTIYGSWTVIIVNPKIANEKWCICDLLVPPNYVPAGAAIHGGRPLFLMIGCKVCFDGLWKRWLKGQCITLFALSNSKLEYWGDWWNDVLRVEILWHTLEFRRRRQPISQKLTFIHERIGSESD